MFLEAYEKLILAVISSNVQCVRSMTVDTIPFSVDAHNGTVADAKLDWKMCVPK